MGKLLKGVIVLCISHVCLWLVCFRVKSDIDAEQFSLHLIHWQKHIMSQHTRGYPVTCWGA